MYYKQSNRIIKYIEPIICLLLYGLVVHYFQLPSGIFHYLGLVFIVMAFSVRYGLYPGLAVFFETVIYTLIDSGTLRTPVIVNFYTTSQWFQWLFLALVAIFCGLMSTSARKKYEDVFQNNTELNTENKELKTTVNLLNDTREKLKNKILESDSQLSKIFEIYKALNHDHPEIVLDESISVMKTYLNAAKIGIYYVGNKGQTLRLKLGSEPDPHSLPQTIFAEQAPDVIRTALTQKRAVFRSRRDPEDAPVLAGPIIFNEQIRYLVILGSIDFESVTSQNFELFVWMLKWISDRLEHATNLNLAELSKRRYTHTNILYAPEFNYLLELEEKRDQSLNYPHVFIEFYLEESELTEADRVLAGQLRDIDILGYDADKQLLLILLPGTDPKYKTAIEKRLLKALPDHTEVAQ